MLQEEGAAPALSCKLAAVVIHRMLVEEGVLSLRCMQARCCCDPQNALCKGRCYPRPCKPAAVVIHRMVEKKVCYPRLLHAAVVMIHRMLWWKKGGAILRCHASCCCQDPQNSGKEGCYPCAHASSLLIHRMLWWKKVCYPALPCKLAAVVITECSGWGVLSLAAIMQLLS
jgi:hypothetical protein